MRQKLQNSKVYAKSPEFSSALGLMDQHMELVHVLSHVFEDSPEHPNSYGSLSSSKQK